MGGVGWGAARKAGVGWGRRRDGNQDRTTDTSHRLSESNLQVSASAAPFFLLILKLNAPGSWQMSGSSYLQRICLARTGVLSYG